MNENHSITAAEILKLHSPLVKPKCGNRQRTESQIRQYLLWSIDFHQSGCWIYRGHTNYAGYGKIVVNGKQHRVHRLFYEMFIGQIPEGLCICHRCDVRNCFNPDHLFLGSPKDNSEDMAKKGRVKTPFPALTAADVHEIRKLISQGIEQRPIAKMFGIKQPHVSKIHRKKSWAHLSEVDYADSFTGESQPNTCCAQRVSG